MAFTLTSPAFANEEMIPRQYTCDGADQSPALIWTDAPTSTRSFALIVHDPDAPSGDFTHWVLYEIPATVESIPEGADPCAAGVPGTNDFGKLGYGGPCPPPGHGPHRYLFRLYALNVERIRQRQGARRAEIEPAIQEHTLGQAQLMGRYERR